MGVVGMGHLAWPLVQGGQDRVKECLMGWPATTLWWIRRIRRGSSKPGDDFADLEPSSLEHGTGVLVCGPSAQRRRERGPAPGAPPVLKYPQETMGAGQ